MRGHALRATRGGPTISRGGVDSLTGYLEVICGSMFSGKSEELIRRTRRHAIARRRVIVFKPSLDDRYHGERVCSHDGNSLEAVAIGADEPERILSLAWEEGAQVVAIDEAQFFADGIAAAAQKLVNRGLRVIVAGLDMDFAGRPFGPMPVLMAMADDVTKLKAVCARCGEPATFNQRLIDGQPARASDPVVLVGGREAYEARCRRCHELAP